jgi:Predicted phosphohydrolases
MRAWSIAAVCAAKADAAPGCDFVLYLGDNIYMGGVESPDDPQLHDKFEAPYADLDLPFHVVLGNHDYGERSLDRDRAAAQVAYAARSDKWSMPDRYYAFSAGPARFFALDTNALMLAPLWGDDGQGAWLSRETGAATEPWRVAFGHHPLRSNGQHGNAGAYEGQAWLPIANGAALADFFEAHVCGQVDIYLSGHDHNRQWLEPHCGVELVVSGAAAKTTPLVGRGAGSRFADDTRAGFAWIALDGDVLTGEFYDQDGRLDYRTQVARRPRGTNPAP